MTATARVERLRIHVYGAVQGVGFRPFVYRLARAMNLAGTVSNSAAGVFIEVEGEAAVCQRFVERLHAERPSASWIAGCEVSSLAPARHRDFRILESSRDAAPTAAILPDLATCPDCLAEMLDPANRRFRYPFINCTHCGPRYTIVEALPYDRPNTTMRGFQMCARCQAEYAATSDRRFHAQPNACPECGPKLDSSVEQAVDTLRAGHTVAIKGIGGFQLLVDAASSDAVRRLRQRKHREEKPFAVLFPDLDAVRAAALCAARRGSAARECGGSHSLAP
jgi:hydrogenase maturation protein HypF